MIISSSQVQNLLKTYNKNVQPVNKVNQVEAPKKGDQLALSKESKITGRAFQAARQAEDVRQDVVNEIKERMSAGTYDVNEDQVAEKMISRAIVDELV
ncbi:MAG: flagellar biosynthesis anti-sigma factor FlgM [Bacillota bacterium]|nr:flagellar biosynthesis anti-sigma factor FlgM [Bacillota bacterium]